MRMSGVLEASEKSAEHAGIITKQTAWQVEAIAAMKEKIEQISQVVALNAQTAVESNEIVGRVSEEMGRMDEIISEFRI